MDLKAAAESYYRWALEELQRRIEDRCECGYEPLDVMDEFVYEMNNYVCEAKTDVAEVMFLSAVEAGERMRDIYIMNEIKEGEMKKHGLKTHTEKFIGWG